MNRRTFLLGLGASACGHAAAKPFRRIPDAPPRPDETHVNVDQRVRASQLRASKIVLHGDVLFQIASAAAALVLEPEAAMRETGGWTVVVVDESGTVRWRAEVPASLAHDFSLTAGFVAIDERRVVLADPDRALVAWDAATGKIVS